MDRRLRLCALAGVLALACGTARAAERDWRRIATDADRDRLRGWRGAWVSALRQVRESPAAANVRALLFDPDRVLAGAVPPPGGYRCRVFKLGGRDAGSPEFAVSVWGRCSLEPVDGGLGFVRESGAQRPVGVIFADTDVRAVFLARR